MFMKHRRFGWLAGWLVWELATVSASASARAEEGAASYVRHCAVCHGIGLQGAAGPALTGEAFVARWNSSGKALYAKIAGTMPLNAPQSLPAADYRALTDYLLARNGMDHRVALGVMAKAKGEEASPVKLPGLPQIFGKPCIRATTIG